MLIGNPVAISVILGSGTVCRAEIVAKACALKDSRGVKKTERKAWKVAMLQLEQSDKRLSKLQDAANKGHEAIEPTFSESGDKPKRARKGDLNQIAASIIEQTTRDKNPAAVELGRLGGLKGGKARAAALSDRRRKLIARNAAKARWKKKA
jgi:hypothetical protein